MRMYVCVCVHTCVHVLETAEHHWHQQQLLPVDRKPLAVVASGCSLQNTFVN